MLASAFFSIPQLLEDPFHPRPVLDLLLNCYSTPRPPSTISKWCVHSSLDTCLLVLIHCSTGWLRFSLRAQVSSTNTALQPPRPKCSRFAGCAPPPSASAAGLSRPSPLCMLHSRTHPPAMADPSTAALLPLPSAVLPSLPSSSSARASPACRTTFSRFVLCRLSSRRPLTPAAEGPLRQQVLAQQEAHPRIGLGMATRPRRDAATDSD